MCGRTACTLAPDEWCAACKREGLQVDWRDAAKQTYFPSYNVAPTSNTPVIVNGELMGNMIKEEVFADYVVQPMMWNLIPHFYKGDTPQSHGYKTNNCRVESVLEKPMFSHLMKKGQRCVVLCDGFYEWQTKGKVKTPYFIYAPQPKSGEEVWSYTVLTTEAGTGFNWLHHRVPVVLSDAAAVQQWLDPSLEPAAALKLVTDEPTLEWHVVSTEVNNSRNKSERCMTPFEQKKTTKGPSNPIMAGWLKKATPSAVKDEPQNVSLKRETDSDQESRTPKKMPKL